MDIQWYNGVKGSIGEHCLAVAFDNGHMQLMKHELDDSKCVTIATPSYHGNHIEPVLVYCSMSVKCISWNCNGSVLAVAGSQLRGDDREICTTQFYNPKGQVRTHVTYTCNMCLYIHVVAVHIAYSWSQYSVSILGREWSQVGPRYRTVYILCQCTL